MAYLPLMALSCLSPTVILFTHCMTKTVTDNDDRLEFWEPLAMPARACGAFPFAFRALHVHRDKKEPEYSNAFEDFHFPEQAFTYTDASRYTKVLKTG